MVAKATALFYVKSLSLMVLFGLETFCIAFREKHQELAFIVLILAIPWYVSHDQLQKISPRPSYLKPCSSGHIHVHITFSEDFGA